MTFQGYYVLHAVYLKCYYTPLLNSKSPYQVLYNKSPNYTNLKIFGCLAFSYTSIQNRSKFDPRGRMNVFVGYKPGCKGYLLLDLLTQQIHVSRHVIFLETPCPFTSADSSSTLSLHTFTNDHFSDSLTPVNPPASSSSYFSYSPVIRHFTRPTHPPSYLSTYECNNVIISPRSLQKVLSHDSVAPNYRSYDLNVPSYI